MSNSIGWLYEFFQSIDSGVASTLSLLIGVTVVLLIGGGITRLWPRASAAQRHLVWSAACWAVLLMPFFQQFVPKYDLHILPAMAPSSETAGMIPVQPIAGMQHAGGAVAEHISEPALATAEEPAAPGVPWIIIAFTIWRMGSFLILLALLRSRHRVNQIVAMASPLMDQRVHRIFAQVASAIGYRGRIELKEHHSAIPMVCGLFRHVIVLPQEVTTWSDERIRHVLLHELAHVVRHDALTQSAASLAVAVYWFHPLAWVTARELRREREQACDDIVLGSGSCPADYATDLLDLTTTLTQFRVASLAALTFARRSSHMHERLQAVLDTTKRRVSVSRHATVATWSAAIGAVALVVGLTLHPKVVAMAAPQPLAQSLPEASRVADDSTAMNEPMVTEVPYLSHDARRVLARVQYTGMSDPSACQDSDSPTAGAWGHDYPMSVEGLLKIFAEVIDAPVGTFEALRVTDTEFMKYPIAMVAEPGCWDPTEAEVQTLQTYLDKGGFLFLDDLVMFSGTPEKMDLSIARTEAWLQRVLPGGRMVPVPASDSLFNNIFKVDPANVPGFSAGPAQVVGIYQDNDPTKALMVVAIYRGSLGHMWRYDRGLGDENTPGGSAVRLGVNILAYGLSH